MAYVAELATGQRIYVDQQGNQTVVTVASHSAQQQQQSSSSFLTGTWTAPPEIRPIGAGAIVVLYTTDGEQLVQVQGSSMAMRSSTGIEPPGQSQPMTAAPTGTMQPIQSMPPMQPMQPMQPMNMGDMQMSLNPMEMRMGDMEMRMGTAASAASAASSASSASGRRFCSQCGTAVVEGDRFCSHCGHFLQ
jgi:hypothetical protein